MENQKIKVPVWYWVVAVFFFLWNLMGIFSFFSQVFMGSEAMETLTPAEQELYNSYPMWTFIVFAIAVFGGTIGSVGLLIRKKWAKTAFVISLMAIIPQMIFNIFFTNTSEVYGQGALFMPITIIIGGVLLVWFASFSVKKGWLK